MVYVCFTEAVMFWGVLHMQTAVSSMVGSCAAQHPSVTNEHSCVRMFSMG